MVHIFPTPAAWEWYILYLPTSTYVSSNTDLPICLRRYTKTPRGRHLYTYISIGRNIFGPVWCHSPSPRRAVFTQNKETHSPIIVVVVAVVLLVVDVPLFSLARAQTIPPFSFPPSFLPSIAATAKLHGEARGCRRGWREAALSRWPLPRNRHLRTSALIR